MRPYPAAITCLTGAIGCIDLLLDILRIVSSSGIFLSLDDFDIVAEGRVVVCFPLHRRLYLFFVPVCDSLTHGVCRESLVKGLVKRQGGLSRGAR